MLAPLVALHPLALHVRCVDWRRTHALKVDAATGPCHGSSGDRVARAAVVRAVETQRIQFGLLLEAFTPRFRW